jgi:hypothetical protein
MVRLNLKQETGQIQDILIDLHFVTSRFVKVDVICRDARTFNSVNDVCC